VTAIMARPARAALLLHTYTLHHSFAIVNAPKPGNANLPIGVPGDVSLHVVPPHFRNRQLILARDYMRGGVATLPRNDL
jgi:hypothetical protein